MTAYDKALLLQLIIQTRWNMLYIESFRMAEPHASKEQRDEYINWLNEQVSLTYKMLELANDILAKTMQIGQINDDNADA